jgi:hypothetical protein
MGAPGNVVGLHWSPRVLSQLDRFGPLQLAAAIRKLIAEGRRAKALVLLEQALVEHPRNAHLVALNGELLALADELNTGDDSTARLQSIRALLATLAVHVLRPERVALVGGATSAQHEPLRTLGITDILRFPESIDRRPPRLFDLLLSIESGQRLQPDHSAALVRFLCERSARIVFSSALPRQPGRSHINCRSQHDWIELFDACGFVCLDAFRPILWQAPHVEPAVRQNAFLFIRRDLRPQHALLHEPSLLDVYHPLLVNARVCQDCLPAEERGASLAGFSATS